MDMIDDSGSIIQASSISGQDFVASQLDLFDTLESPPSGFFSLLIRPPLREPYQRSYRLDLMPQVLAALDPHLDSYISQAQFFKPNRRVVNLWRVSLAWVDLDTYGTEWGHLDPEPLSLALRQFCRDEGIPQPTLIIHSGRGLYAKWLFETPIPRPALPRWSAVQRELATKLTRFGADLRARDASRVLRLIQTTNTKQPDPAKRTVRLLHAEEVNGELLRYDFDAFADEVLPFTRAELAELRSSRASGKAKVLDFATGPHAAAKRFTAESLHWARLEDMQRLITLRGGQIEEGSRETFLFLMLNSGLQSGQFSTRDLYRESEALARRINPDFRRGTEWSYGTLGTLYRRAKGEQAGGALYRFRTSTLMEWLEITPEEERELTTLISTGEKNRRRREQRGSEASRKQRDQIIVAGHKSGLTHSQIIADIQRLMGQSVTRMTVHRVLRKYGM